MESFLEEGVFEPVLFCQKQLRLWCEGACRGSSHADSTENRSIHIADLDVDRESSRCESTGVVL